MIRWREEAIARRHRRADFDCGHPELNDYLAQHARQNHGMGASKTFVAVPIDDANLVLGYYSMCPGQLEFDGIPAEVKRRLARYPVPVYRLGRLAVGLEYQRQGLGGALLMAAGQRALAVALKVGGFALAIDAKDSQAAAWYARFGATPLLDDPLKLILPLETIRKALAAQHAAKAGATASE